MYKIISHNVRGLNGSRKRRQVFRWLYQQNSDIILLQETYSSPDAIGRWEAEWGGKIISSHGSTHSRGVMILLSHGWTLALKKSPQINTGDMFWQRLLLITQKLYWLMFMRQTIQTNRLFS